MNHLEKWMREDNVLRAYQDFVPRNETEKEIVDIIQNPTLTEKEKIHKLAIRALKITRQNPQIK